MSGDREKPAVPARRRPTHWLRWIGGVSAALLVAALIALSLPTVQWALWQLAARRIEQATGLRVEVRELSLRPWPAALWVRGLTVSPRDRAPIATADTLSARWSWIALARSRRLEKVAFEGLRVTVPPSTAGAPTGQAPDASSSTVVAPAGNASPSGKALQTDPPAAGPAVAPHAWPVIAIDSLEVHGGAATLALGIAGFQAEGVQVGANLVNQHARLDLTAATASLLRQDRRWVLGRLDAAAEATPAGLILEHADIEGGSVEAHLKGSARPIPGTSEATAEVRATVPAAAAVDWWDPSLRDRLEAGGTVRFAGTVTWHEGGGLAVEGEGHGEGLHVAGYAVSDFRVSTPGGKLVVVARDPSWGEITVGPDPLMTIPFSASLHEMPLDKLREHLPPQIRSRLPAGATVSGTLSGRAAIPIGLQTLDVSVALTLSWPGGRLTVSGRDDMGALSGLSIQAALPGATAHLDGSATVGADIDVTAGADVSEPARLAASLSAWLPSLPQRAPGGGPLHAELAVSGRWATPNVSARVRWQHPELAGYRLDSLSGELRGNDEGALWNLTASLGAATATVAGDASLRRRAGTAVWTVAGLPAEAAAALVAPGAGLGLQGDLDGHGMARLDPQGWAIDGVALRWSDPRLGRFSADAVSLEGSAGSGGVEVDALTVLLPEGRLDGRASLQGLTPAAPLTLELHWRDIGVETVAPSLPAALAGCLDGDVDLGGTLAVPAGTALLGWRPRSPDEALEPFSLEVTLAGGSIQVRSEQLVSVAGQVVVEASMPLGDVPRPPWLFPGAPRGKADITAHADHLELTPLVSLLGPRARTLPIRSGLDLSATLDPLAPHSAEGRLELPGLTLGEGAAAIHAAATPTLSLSGARLELRALDLEGPGGTIAGHGSVDLQHGSLDVSLTADLAPVVVEIVVPAVSVRAPVEARLSLSGPLAAPTGSVSLRQADGSIVVVDPPIRITGLDVQASFADDVIDIDQGVATVNGGRIDLAGGWDTKVQQGVVAELHRVHFALPEGILVALDGLVAVEPRSDGRMALVGDVDVVRGEWGSNFDLTGAILGRGESTAPPPVDDPLDRVDVDLQVTTASGIQVDNNLGSFLLRWQRLALGGTLGHPALGGEIRAVPGGELTLGGSLKEIKSGVIAFPGEYGAQPSVEIVTETPQGLGPTSATQQLGLADLAQAGLLGSVGSVIGLSNSNLTPIDIASETGANPGTSLTVARVFTQHSALFFTTDLTNTQDQTTLLQLWNWRAVPGFAIQGFTSSNEGDGVAVLERFNFGGTARSRMERPTLDAIRFEGSWPVKTGALREAVGFTRGQPFEPFMVFVGEARLEEALASAGYFEPRVTGSTSGASGKILSYTVEPGPHVRIAFSGADLPLATKERVRALYEPPPLERWAVADMKTALESELAVIGYPFATVTAAIEPDGVTFTIDEGRHIALERLDLTGVPDATRRAIEPLMSSAPILAALLAGDQAAISRMKDLLAGDGFPDAKVIGSTLRVDKDRDEGTVETSVDAGARIHVGRVVLEGEDPLGVLAAASFPIRPGVPLRRRALNDAVSMIRDRYANDGYLTVSVRTRVVEQSGDAWEVRITLDPGERLTVSDVVIRGAPDISRKVLRKGITLKKGDVVRLSALDTTASNIASFDPVASARVSRTDHGTTSTIDIALTEKPRWTVGTGVRYRSGTGAEMLLDLRDTNLFGNGLSAALTGHYGGDNRAARLYLYLPPPPGKRLSFDGWWSLSYLRQNGVIERTNTQTLEARLVRQAGIELRGYLSREKTRTTGDSASSTVPEQIVTLASVGSQIIVDRRNDFFNPTHGWYGALDVSYSPLFLGSTDRIIRGLGSYSVATTAGPHWIWAQGLRVGAARSFDGPLPETHTARFFAGGETSIRGFDQDTVGPTALIDGTLQPIGGGALLVINEELRYRLTSGILLAAFVDAGQVSEDWASFNYSLSAGSGLGVRVLTPIGPVRVDVAWPVLRPNGNSGAKFYIGIGEVF